MSGKLMGAVTHGKYDELGVDSGFSLSFRPETGNGGRITKGEEFMSAGTSDAAYVSREACACDAYLRGGQASAYVL